MKKIISSIIGFAVFSAIFMSCGTTAGVKGSSFKGDAATVKNVTKEIIDYQGATFGVEIPQWVIEVATGNRTEQYLKKYIPGIEGKKAFVVIGRGDNLEHTQDWVEMTRIEVAVGDEMQRIAGKAVSAKQQSQSKQSGDDRDETTLTQELNMYKQAVSAVELNGLEEIASYWVQVQILPADKDSGEEVKKYYEYYTVWGMNQNLYNIQIKKAMESVADNTDEGKALKEALSLKLQSMMITSNDDSVNEEAENEL